MTEKENSDQTTGLEPTKPSDRYIIEKLEKLILIHSYIYYWLDFNVITDSEFDKMAFELKKMVREHPLAAQGTIYYDDFVKAGYFEDNCPSGFNLPYRKEEIIASANKLLGRS